MSADHEREPIVESAKSRGYETHEAAYLAADAAVHPPHLISALIQSPHSSTLLTQITGVPLLEMTNCKAQLSRITFTLPAFRI